MSDQVIEKTKKTWLGMAILLLVILAATVAFGYGYFRLTQTVVKLQLQVSTAHADYSTLKTDVDQARQLAEKSEALSAKQEQIITEWQAAQKGDLNKWYVAEAQYLVRLANDHLEFSHNLGMASTLLQRAKNIIDGLQDSNLSSISQSLGNDIAVLKSAQAIDITSVYLRLTALNSELDKLPLPLDPQNPLLALQEHTAPMTTEAQSWWRTAMGRVLQGLDKIIIVRDTNVGASPITLPEEKLFLYQNLHAQMENAMWGVLNHNPEVYQSSLARVSTWIQRYFVGSAPATIAMLQNLQALRGLSVRPAVSNLNATLQLFDQFYG